MILAIVFQSFGKVYVFVDYLFYKNYYADVLCINKDKPDLKCEGKCAFMQKIKNQEKSETPISNVVYKLFESVWYLDSATYLTPASATVFTSIQYPSLAFATQEGAAFELEKPPVFSLI